MTDAERRVVEAAIRLVTRMKAWHWTWPVEATSLMNVVDDLTHQRTLRRSESDWPDRMARG